MWRPAPEIKPPLPKASRPDAVPSPNRFAGACLAVALILSPQGHRPVSAAENLPGPRNVRFQRLTAEQGLPDSQVNDFYQDRLGFMWFATRDGLAKFDGYDFTVYRHDPADPDSLYGSYVLDIDEDLAGDLWLTLGVEGIDRFQRSTGRFTHFSNHPHDPHSLSGGTVTDFALDASGQVWIATLQSGLNRLQADDRAVRYRHDPQNPLSLSHDWVRGLLVDDSGQLWIATAGGLDRYEVDGSGKEGFVHYRHDPGDPASLSSNSVTALFQDPQGYLWVGTEDGGLDRMGSGEGGVGREAQFVRYGFGDPHNQGLPPTSVSHIAADPTGLIWVALAGRGVAALDPAVGLPRFYHGPSYRRGKEASGLNDDHVQFLHVDRWGGVWVGTTHAGLHRYDRAGDRFESYRHDPADDSSLSSDRLLTVHEDPTGSLWISTAGEGVNVFSPSRWKFRLYRHDPQDPQSLRDNRVQALAEGEDGRVWIATQGGGLSAFDPQRETFTHYRHDPQDPYSLAQDNVSALVVDSQGTLWVGTASRGLDRFDPATGRFFHHRWRPDDPTTLTSDAVTCLALGNENGDRFGIWVGHDDRGFDRVDIRTGEVTRYRLDLPVGVAVWTLHQDSRNLLWIGTPTYALHRFDPETGDLKQYIADRQDPRSLNNLTVNSLYEDSQGRLWVGTFSGGLELYDRRRGSFRHFTVDDGLPSNMIQAILEDDSGHLWLATNHGIAHFDPQGRAVVKSYDRRDGLQHNELSRGVALRTGDGEMFFGGRHGLNRFRPDDIQENPNPPPVVLTVFRSAEREIELPSEAGTIELSHRDNDFSFEFAALDYTDPGKNRYAYRLEGFDRDWVECGTERSASYTNIDAGEYVFQVKGSNSDEVWSYGGTSVRLRIRPPFWGTWWFYCLEFCAAAALLLAGFVGQQRRLKAQTEEELRRRDHERKTEELEFARQVQWSMLPDADLVTDRFEAVGRMITATEVGGDYFDFVDLGRGAHCFAIGDAIGHGTAAGLVVGMAKATILQALKSHSEVEDGPVTESLIAALNETLHSSIAGYPTGMGLGLVVLDGASGAAEISSVAMPPPYHYAGRTQTLTPLDLRGLPLGLRKEIRPQSQRLHLAPGDFLVLMSDGFAERNNRDDVWGYAALEETLLRVCRRETRPETVAEEIIAACNAYAGNEEPEDDMTVVVVRVHD